MQSNYLRRLTIAESPAITTYSDGNMIDSIKNWNGYERAPLGKHSAVVLLLFKAYVHLSWWEYDGIKINMNPGSRLFDNTVHKSKLTWWFILST